VSCRIVTAMVDCDSHPGASCGCELDLDSQRAFSQASHSAVIIVTDERICNRHRADGGFSVQILSMPPARNRSISPTFSSRSHRSVGRTSGLGYPNVVSGRLLGIVFRGAGLERWHKAFKLNWALAPEASAKNEGYFWDKTPVANYFDVVVVDEERHDPGGACYRNRSSTLHH